jgi:hypothetical protein
MATTRDDTAHASVLVAESVVALARAELRLAVSSFRASGVRLAVAIALSALSLLLVQVAFAVVALSPVLYGLRPGSTLAALALSLGIATVTSLLTLQRWRSFGRRPAADESRAAAAPELRGSRT